ncbi:MAG: hypothetical protein EAZ46_10965 [Runella sp.]|nr:MAG: hypothetical protein EAZ46_10965 [Runella sp.]
MKTKILFLSICIAINLSTLAQQRNVHWIHGLGGNATSWQLFGNDFNIQRNILTNTVGDYNTANGVGGMVGDIQNQIGGAAGGNSIGICHSMGGVAGRQLDVQNNGFFGGIITFGSPLRGARVVNNVNNGVATQYIDNAINKLLAGPQSEPIFNAIIRYFQNRGNLPIQDLSGNGIIQEVRNQLGLTPQTTNDLAEESGYNQGFYGNGTNTPKLIFWGNENSPIHVRLAAGAAGADEEQWVGSWNSARQTYGAMRDYNYTMRWAFPILLSLFNWRGNQWARGYDYLLDQSENEWANLIGGGFSFQQTVTDYLFVGINLEDYDNCIIAANGDPNQIHDQTDGLVPRRSQIAENTAWSSNAEIRELAGNNHQEMRTSNRSRFELNRAFDGQSQAGPAFSIPTR